MSNGIRSGVSLIENESLSKHRVDKNRLRLVSMINFFTFICAIFSMSFYQWVHISFQTKSFSQYSNTQPSQLQATTIQLWSNLLYACIDDHCYITYQEVQNQLCLPTDIGCLAIFYELDFIGKLCFGIISFAFLISSYDFIRIITFTLKDITTKSKFFIQSNSAINFKNNFRSGIMILIYAVGLSLDFFGMSLINVDSYTYGISFWLFLCSILLFVGVSVWQNRKMSKILKQQLIIKLLEGQKHILKSNLSQDMGSKASNSDIFSI